MFDIKSYFHYRAPAKGLECFAIRKTNWRRLQLKAVNNDEQQMTWNHILLKYRQQQLLDFLRVIYMPMQQLKKQYLNKSTSLVNIQVPLKTKRGWEITVNDPMLDKIVKKTLNEKDVAEEGSESFENQDILDHVRQSLMSMEHKFKQQKKLVNRILSAIKVKE